MMEHGSTVEWLSEETKKAFIEWRGEKGPPVPVIIRRDVLDKLQDALRQTTDPTSRPRVFRLFAERGQPRRVVMLSEIEDVWKNKFGTIRWTEEGYPNDKSKPRKGGNAFLRGDTDLSIHDAWWMGREQTESRLLLRMGEGGKIHLSAWYGRGGARLGNRTETDGDVWPARLLIEVPLQ